MECLFGQTLVAEILTSPRLNYQWPNGQVAMSDSNLLPLTNTVTPVPFNRVGSLTMWALGRGTSAAQAIGLANL